MPSKTSLIFSNFFWSSCSDNLTTASAPFRPEVNNPIRRFDHVTSVHVILSVDKLVQKAEVTLHVKGKDIFVEQSCEDMYAAIDMLIDKYLDAEPEEWTAYDYQAPEGFLMNKMYALRRFTSAWARARSGAAGFQSGALAQPAKASTAVVGGTKYIKLVTEAAAPR